MGITADGTKETIATNVQVGQYIEVNDTARKYVSLQFEFATPIKLDNQAIYINNHLELTDTERAKWDSGERGGVEQYRVGAQAEYSDNTDPAVEHPSVIKSQEFFDKNAGIWLSAFAPAIDENVPQSQQVVYTAGGTPFTLRVGPTQYEGNSNSSSLNGNFYGDIKQVDVKTITLLPEGYEFEGLNKEDSLFKYSVRNTHINPDDVQASFVRNYKGTGKNAVIVSYGSIPANFSVTAPLKLRATLGIKPGEQDVPTYLLYNNNDVIYPAGHIELNDNSYTIKPRGTVDTDYKDELDLDDDGNTDEYFMQVHSKLSFIPPLELLSYSRVGVDKPIYTETEVDLGSKLFYGLTILNNSVQDSRAVSLIDVLPYVGDHAIAPNGEGEYTARDSKFATPLLGALEDVPENKELLDRFEIAYQLTPQGSDLASVRDGQWLTKDQIRDFSQVKSFKIVLKPGQSLKSKEEVTFKIPAMVPFDTTLVQNKEGQDIKAVNSIAISANNKDYAESLQSVSRPVVYKVSGIAFDDTNKNGIQDEGEKPLSGVSVMLFKDGAQVTDHEGQPLSATTDENGSYSFDVYTRSDTYSVEFKAPYDHRFSEAHGAGTNNDVSTIKNETFGTTTTFALNPQATTQTMNAALYSIRTGSIEVTKTDSTDSHTPLKGAKFKLKGTATYELDEEGNTIRQIGEDIEKTLTTDELGKAVFDSLVPGTYTITEIEAPEGYAIDNTKAVEASVSLENPKATLSFTDTKIKGTITITKTGADNTKLAGATFELR